MNWMETLSRYPWPLYLAVGLVAGFFVGYQVLPELRPRKIDLVKVEESAAQLESVRGIEEGIAADLARMQEVTDARVLLSVAVPGTKKAHPEASVTLDLSTQLSEEQLVGIAEKVANGVNGLVPLHVSISDASGISLNRETLMRQQTEQLWKDIAINVAKILGIIAALITVKFIIEAIGRGVMEEKSGC